MSTTTARADVAAVFLRAMQVITVATAIGASLILVSNLLLFLLGTWIS